MKLKTLHTASKEIQLKDKKVLLRVDYNVPVENGTVADDTRIRESLKTIEFLIKMGAKIILMSHLGRPKGVDENYRLNPVASHLSKLLNKPVIKVDSCIGASVEAAANAMRPGDVLMLENTRFYKEEEENDKTFSKQLANIADIYVSDAFGTVHRAHASTEGVAHFLPSFAGFLIEKEIENLEPLLKNPAKPLILLIGGAKIDTKIGILKNFIHKADTILIGGGLANTFLAAKGHDIGLSLCEKDKIETAQDILIEAEKTKCKIVLPEDVIVADEISDNAITADAEITGVEGNMQILDLGKRSVRKYIEILNKAKTIIWNGPVGLYEKKPFENGTREIAIALSKVKAKTYLGGGDTIDAINKFGINEKSFTHVSTGGGAMLEYLEGKELPGIKVLMA
ncbi:phosphoglycerate kinase [Candidatus Peregrinibacteria bacterium]|nr:phosphoglycerate kinase [Candidatus Peregrinibacteria bacterium]